MMPFVVFFPPLPFYLYTSVTCIEADAVSVLYSPPGLAIPAKRSLITSAQRATAVCAIVQARVCGAAEGRAGSFPVL